MAGQSLVSKVLASVQAIMPEARNWSTTQPSRALVFITVNASRAFAVAVGGIDSIKYSQLGGGGGFQPDVCGFRAERNMKKVKRPKLRWLEFITFIYKTYLITQ